MSMFAADLDEVILKKGKRPIYEDPTKFFALTYPTFSLRELAKDVVLAGNLFQTLDRIDHIAGDFTWNQMGGGCGKGGQFPLPVTEGAPHVRIEEALIGGDV